MYNMFSIKDKKTIITGGCTGLGSGIVHAYLQAGAKVGIIDINPETGSIASGFSENCFGISADLGDRMQLRDAFDKAVVLLNGLDVIVNNAGTQRRSKSEEFSIEDWDRVIEVNLTSVFELCQLAGKKMLDQGYGKIINIASMLSFFGGFTVPAYAASKGGVAQLTKTLANEWADRGVNVNAIAPGFCDTDLNKAIIADKNRFTQITARIPAGRWGKPEDLGGIAIFLASEASRYINGAIIPVDGGYLGR